jgi:hypothetical protein
MHKSAMKCNETLGKWCKNKHGASKIIDTFETYQSSYVTKRKLEANEALGHVTVTIHMNSYSSASFKKKMLQ